MAVRVRCPQCEKVVNAPDGAKGKAVKCPECEARIPVPANGDDSAKGSSKAAAKPAAKSPAKPAAKKKAADDDDFLAKLDLSRSEDASTRVCPKCGQDVEEEDTECPSCGIDLQTGGLGKAARKARMKGPDPNDFYGIAFKDGAQFVKQNLPLVISSSLNILILFVASAVTLGLGFLFQSFDHMPSAIAFWALGTLATIGSAGWFLSLSTKVTQFALEKKIKLDRTSFEMFTAMAMGISWLIWLIASAIPFAPIWLPVYFATQASGPAINYGVPVAIAVVLSCIPVPVVMAHRAMPVNWMIWVSPLMWKIAGKTIGGVIFCWVVAFVTWLPIALLVFCELMLFKSFGVGALGAIKIDISSMAAKAADQGISLSTDSVGIVTAIFVLLGMLILRLMTLFAYTVWAMYMIRVVAQFTFYNKKKLELVNEILQKKYVAKQVELDEHGDPIRKSNLAVTITIIVVVLIVLYAVANVVLAQFAPEYLLMPRSWAVTLKLLKE